MHKFLWNGYSADKFRWDGMFHRALAADTASLVVVLVAAEQSSSSLRHESTRSFWLPDYKEQK